MARSLNNGAKLWLRADYSQASGRSVQQKSARGLQIACAMQELRPNSLYRKRPVLKLLFVIPLTPNLPRQSAAKIRSLSQAL